MTSWPGAWAPGLELLVRRDLVADLLQRPPDQARDVHLRDPDLLCDLALRQPVEEAQVEDPALALVEHAEAGREHGAILRDRVLVLLGAERLERIELAVLVGAAGRERERRVGAARLERLEHELLLDAGSLGELGNRRRAPELDGLVLDDLRELDVQLLEAARNAHGPALVAEVALDLADDVRRRVRRQLDAAVDVEAVDRLDQADAADLDEVVELLAPVGVAAGERADEREVLLDQLLARGEVALLVVAAQQHLVGHAGHACRPRRHVALAEVDPGAAVAAAHASRRRRSSRAACAGRATRPRPTSSSAGRALAERPHRDVDRVVADSQQDADLAVVGVVVLEQRARGRAGGRPARRA